MLTLTDKGYHVYVVSNQIKDNKSFILYTFLNFEGIDICKGLDPFDLYHEPRDSKYFKRIKEADKTPKFVTQVFPDGSQKLVLYQGQSVSESDCPEYDEFVATYIQPFANIKPVDMKQILEQAKENQK